MDIFHFLFLSCVGLVTVAQAQDCSRPVLGENMDLKGDDILRQSFPDGTTVRLACSTGYSAAGGSTAITCTAGTWSRVSLRCERRSCGAVEDLLNGEVQYPDGNQFGDTARFVCKSGYSLVGKDTCLCGVQGWECRLPRCEVVTCDPPPTITGGSYHDDKDVYNYREVVEYSCDSGLTLIGSATSTCSENGQFQPSPPQCKKVECPDVQVDNGRWAEGSRPPHGYQATVRFTCNSGFKILGQATIKCGSDNRWSPDPPLCQDSSTVTTCDRPRDVDHGSFSPDKPTYQVKETLTFVCDEDYTMSGSPSLSCSKYGKFEPDPPTCTKPIPIWVIVVIVLVVLIIIAAFAAAMYFKTKKKSSLKVHNGQKTKGQKGTEDESGVILSERTNEAAAEKQC